MDFPSLDDIKKGARKVAGVATGYDTAKALAKGDLKGAAKSVADPYDVLGKAKDAIYGDSLNPTDTSALGADRDRTLDLYHKLQEEKANGLPGVAPVNASQEDRPGQVQAVDAPAPDHVQQRTVAPGRDVQVNLPNEVERVQGRDVAIPTVGPAAQASAAGAVASQINRAGVNDVASQQKGYLDTLQSTINGTAPSVAEGQLRRGMNTVAQEQLGAVGQARGNERAGARLAAILGIGTQGQKTATDAAMLRAQERATALGQVGGTLEGMRGSEQALATTQAGLDTDVNKQNAAVESDVGKFDTGQTNDMTKFGKTLATGVATDNANRDVGVQTTNTAAGNSRVLAGAQLRAGVDTSNADRTVGVDTGNANRGVAVDTGNVDRDAAHGEKTADRETGVAVGNVDRTTAVGARNADRVQGAATTTAANSVTTRAQDISRAQGLDSNILNANDQASGITKSQIGEVDKNKDRQAKTGDAVLGATVGGVEKIAAAQTAAPDAPPPANPTGPETTSQAQTAAPPPSISPTPAPAQPLAAAPPSAPTPPPDPAGRLSAALNATSLEDAQKADLAPATPAPPAAPAPPAPPAVPVQQRLGAALNIGTPPAADANNTSNMMQAAILRGRKQTAGVPA